MLPCGMVLMIDGKSPAADGSEPTVPVDPRSYWGRAACRASPASDGTGADGAAYRRGPRA